MAIVLPVRGQADWDITNNAALSQLESEIVAAATTTSNSLNTAIANEVTRANAAYATINDSRIVGALQTVFTRTTIVTDHTILSGEHFIAVTTLSAGIGVKLPDATINATQIYTVKDEAGQAALNNITVSPLIGGQLLDGGGSKIINTNYGSMRFYSNGTNWFTVL